MPKKLLILCLPLLILFSACGSEQNERGKTEKVSSASETTKTTATKISTTTAPATPVMDISAFIAEFDANTEVANTKYKGKKIELTGPYVIAVLARGTNTQGPYFMLAPISGESYNGTVVKCYSTTEEASKYYEGKQIRVTGTVEGIAPGYSGIIDISNCTEKS